MSSWRRPPPEALSRPGSEWSERERDEVLNYVQRDLREQLLVRAGRYRHDHPNPGELVGTFLSSDALSRAIRVYEPSKGSFLALIVTAFHGHCVEFLRWLNKRARRGDHDAERLVEVSTKRVEALVAAGKGQAAPLAASLEQRQLFRAALQRLSSAQRALLLASANGHSLKELKVAFGYATTNTVKTKVAEARQRFRVAAIAVGLTPRSVRLHRQKHKRTKTQ